MQPTDQQLINMARNFYTYGWLDAISVDIKDISFKVSEWPKDLQIGRKKAAKQIRETLKKLHEN